MTTSYAVAASAEPSAPTPKCAPFTAQIEQQPDGRHFVPTVVDSQMRPILVGYRRYLDPKLAQKTAEQMRRILLIRFKASGESAFR